MVLDLFIIILLLFIIGLGSTCLCEYLNRHYMYIEKIAKKNIHKRLKKRKEKPIKEILEKAGIPKQLQWKGICLLEELANELETDVTLLRAEDKLIEIVQLKREELKNVNPTTWKKANLQNHITIFPWEFMEFLISHISNSKWRNLDSKFLPKNENEWVDFLEEMTLKEIVEFFVPILEFPEKIKP